MLSKIVAFLTTTNSMAVILIIENLVRKQRYKMLKFKMAASTIPTIIMAAVLLVENLELGSSNSIWQERKDNK